MQVHLSFIPVYHEVKSYAFENLIFNVAEHSGLASLLLLSWYKLLLSTDVYILLYIFSTGILQNVPVCIKMANYMF